MVAAALAGKELTVRLARSLGLPGFKRVSQQVGTARLFYLSAVTGGHVAVHWFTQLLTLALPSLKADLGLSDVQVGGITTAYAGVSSATSLPSGYVADSYRKRGALIMASALAAFGLAYLLMGLAPSYAWLLPAAGLVGLGTALWHPAALAGLSLRFPDRRGMALSVHGVGASIGDTVGPVAVGAVMAVLGWRRTLELHLIPALLIGLLLWQGLRRMYREEGAIVPFRAYVGDLRRMLVSQQVWAVLASNSLMSMARLSILTFLPIYISETLGYSSFVLGVYITLLYGLGALSQPVMGIVSDRFGRKWVLLPSFTAMGLLFMALAYAASGLQLALVIAALGMFFYAVLNITQSAIMDVAGEGVQASTMGVLGLFSQPFTLSAPIVAGYLVTGFGIKAAFWYAAVTALLASAVLVPVRFRRVPLQRPA
jgi:MFS family permease